MNMVRFSIAVKFRMTKIVKPRERRKAKGERRKEKGERRKGKGERRKFHHGVARSYTVDARLRTSPQRKRYR
jgi:hypothetical protein